jgi:hypothetical protein
MAMATSVEESSSNLLQRHLVPAIVAWMREVPASSNQSTSSIEIVGMIADWLHLLRPACFVNVVGSHVTLDRDSLELV